MTCEPSFPVTSRLMCHKNLLRVIAHRSPESQYVHTRQQSIRHISRDRAPWRHTQGPHRTTSGVEYFSKLLTLGVVDDCDSPVSDRRRNPARSHLRLLAPVGGHSSGNGKTVFVFSSRGICRVDLMIGPNHLALVLAAIVEIRSVLHRQHINPEYETPDIFLRQLASPWFIEQRFSPRGLVS